MGLELSGERKNLRPRGVATGDRGKPLAAEPPHMTVVAFLSVAPVTDESMAPEVAKAVAALDEFDVSYETNPMGTVIEADDVDTLLDAVGAAHETVDGDRVSTFLKNVPPTYNIVMQQMCPQTG